MGNSALYLKPALALVSLILARPATAEGSYQVLPRDPQFLSCSSWLDRRRAHQAGEQESWIYGFATGMALTSDSLAAGLRDFAPASLLSETDEACKRRQSWGINDALINVLYNHKTSQEKHPN